MKEKILKVDVETSLDTPKYVGEPVCAHVYVCVCVWPCCTAAMGPLWAGLPLSNQNRLIPGVFQMFSRKASCGFVKQFSGSRDNARVQMPSDQLKRVSGCTRQKDPEPERL